MSYSKLFAKLRTYITRPWFLVIVSTVAIFIVCLGINLSTNTLFPPNTSEADAATQTTQTTDESSSKTTSTNKKQIPKKATSDSQASDSPEKQNQEKENTEPNTQQTESALQEENSSQQESIEKQTNSTTPQNNNIQSSTSTYSSDSNDTEKTVSASQTQQHKKQESSTNAQASEKTWVEPIYEEIFHPEEGHYETVNVNVQKVKCRCGALFATADEWKTHQNDYIARMRVEKNDPNYTCDGTHGTSHYVTVTETEERYIVDREAYTEQVLIQEGYWK